MSRMKETMLVNYPVKQPFWHGGTMAFRIGFDAERRAEITLVNRREVKIVAVAIDWEVLDGVRVIDGAVVADAFDFDVDLS